MDAASSAMEAAAGQAVTVILAIGALGIGLRLILDIVARSIRRGRRTTRRGQAPRPGAAVPAATRDRADVAATRDRADVAAAQMRAVADAAYERKPLLNRTEARLLPVLDRAALAAGPGFRVMAQVALNEVIRPARGADEGALGAIVTKRLDFAIVDRRGMVACAVEYQGEGHWGDHAAMRDAVKREALRKAGVRLVEVHAGAAEAWVLAAVAETIGAAENGRRRGSADPDGGAARSADDTGQRHPA